MPAYTQKKLLRYEKCERDESKSWFCYCCCCCCYCFTLLRCWWCLVVPSKFTSRTWANKLCKLIWRIIFHGNTQQRCWARCATRKRRRNPNKVYEIVFFFLLILLLIICGKIKWKPWDGGKIIRNSPSSNIGAVHFPSLPFQISCLLSIHIVHPPTGEPTSALMI
jgi:hypothetical protein